MEETDTIKTIYESVKEKLDFQLQTADSLDTKAGVCIGFNGIIITLAFNVYEKAYPSWLFIIGICFLIMSIFMSIRGYKTESFRRDPDPTKLREKYSQKTSKKVLGVLIDNLIDSYQSNANILKKKALKVNWALYFIFIGLILFVISVFIGRYIE